MGGPKWLRGCYGGMVQFERLAAAVILIVEDDARVQLELADWLTNLGLTILTADNADQGLALLDKRL